MLLQKSSLDLIRLDPSEDSAFDRLAARHRGHFSHDAVYRRGQAVLHLHGFHKSDAGALLHALTWLDEHGDDLAVHRRAHHSVATKVAGVRRVVTTQCHMKLATASNDHRAARNFDESAAR